MSARGTAAATAAETYPAWVAALARLLLRVFFGAIEVAGQGQAPPGHALPGRPLLYVANHNNGLVDPLLVLGFLPGRPRFLGKATLWRLLPLRPFLALGRVIPVHRPQDPGFASERNQEVFERSREVLEAGGAIALFPEGKSHAGPALAELRTGAARILAGLPAQARARVAVVPVGLHYDAPARFRSRVLVQVGEPLPPEALAGEDGVEPEAVRRLTARLADALDGVTLSYGSWDEARVLRRAADLWLAPDPELPLQPPLAERFAARRRVLEAYRRLGGATAERLRPLAGSVAAYDRLLDAFELRDEQVTASYPLPSVLRFLARSLWVLLVRAPLAAAGAVLGFVPWRLCAIAAALVAHQPDQPATYKLFGGILLYPLFWALEALLAAWLLGAGWGVVVGVLAPLGGWAAVRFRDRLRLLRTEARAYLVLRGRDGVAAELRRRRAEVLAELAAVAAELGEPPPGIPPRGRAGARAAAPTVTPAGGPGGPGSLPTG